MKIKRIKIALLFICFLTPSLYAKRSKKYQMIDLGAISIEGEVITPSDLSIVSDSEESTLELYKRKNYRNKININLHSIF